MVGEVEFISSTAADQQGKKNTSLGAQVCTLFLFQSNQVQISSDQYWYK